MFTGGGGGSGGGGRGGSREPRQPHNGLMLHDEASHTVEILNQLLPSTACNSKTFLMSRIQSDLAAAPMILLGVLLSYHHCMKRG